MSNCLLPPCQGISRFRGARKLYKAPSGRSGMDMRNAKTTRDGLPVVSAEAIQCFMRDAAQRYREGSESLEKCRGEVQTRMQAENPLLVQWLADYGGRNIADSSERREFYGGAMLAYELLRRQAQANTLNQEWSR